MKRDADRATLEGQLRGMERILACLLASLEPRQYEKIKNLLEQMKFETPQTPWHAIKIPESIQACRQICTYAESTRPILDEAEEWGL